ncbi:hypothetical protein ACVWYG_003398 [Pedobacter sp. UYEF25]
MKKLSWLSVILFSIVSCTNNPKSEQESSTNQEVVTSKNSDQANLQLGCYQYAEKGDLINMEITELGEKVTANLNIAYAEKDANKGKFVGRLTGDKLIGNYTFNSEGVESVRQVAFLVNNNQLFEGYGEMGADGTKFKDIRTIKYPTNMPLKKVDCLK